MSDQENIPNNFVKNEEELSFEERFKQVVDKLRPYVKQLWDSRKKLIIFNTVVLALTLAYLLFLTKPYYKSTVTILPDYGNRSSEIISGLSSLTGVNIGDTPPTQIYQNLITSESVMSDVIYSKYQTEKFAKPVNLIDYFEIKPDKSLPKYLQGRKMFLSLYPSLANGIISSELDRITKILSITVQMSESKLSADVANKITESLNNYILTKRKSFATEQRKYLERRVAQIKDTLTYFEERLKDFRSQNRVIIQSPELQLEQARFMRNAEIQQAIYIELVRQLELVKLQEVKDTPVINIKEEAKEPILKAGPKRINTLLINMFLSAIFSVGYFVFSSSIKKYVRIALGLKD